MNATGYKMLGFLVWQGGRWYVRRNYGRYVPSPRTAGAAAGLAVLSLGGLAVLSTRRSSQA